MNGLYSNRATAHDFVANALTRYGRNCDVLIAYENLSISAYRKLPMRTISASLTHTRVAAEQRWGRQDD